MKSIVLMIAALCVAATVGSAGDLQPREGWVVLPTPKTHRALVAAVIKATKDNGMGVVTQAGPTEAAAKRGITIPSNRVIGVFNNDFAVKVLALSTAAMIEAPIRIYVTENADQTATLSYKKPTFVLAPYVAEGGPELQELATQLDIRFAEIAAVATR